MAIFSTAATVIGLASQLSKVVPGIVGLFGGDDAKEKAEEVIGMAREVTGLDDPQEAVDAINADPEQARLFQGKLLDHQIALREADLKEKQEHNRHTETMEGTAKDLLSMPFFGRLMIFLRGSQRVIWGFGALYMTFMVISGSWKFQTTVLDPTGAAVLVGDPQKMFLFICIDILVLATLFGERAVRNILPIVLDKLLPFFGGVKAKS